MNNGAEESQVESHCIFKVIICILLAVMYVGSLYIWGKNERRNHPSTVKKRSFSVFMMSFISALFVYLFADKKYFGYDVDFWSLIGLRTSGIFPAVFLPLILTMILFLGPIILQYCDGGYSNFCDIKFWSYCLTNILWLRNHVIAPFFEEFTFRACMLPILVPCFGYSSSVILCPIFFGIAHLHHLIEKLMRGVQFKVAFPQCLFQFAYTTVFGAYSTYLFLRTGHVLAPFIVHAFCNFMGFPDFDQLMELQQPKRTLLMICFVVGLILWILLLKPFTDPSLYNNVVFVPVNPS